MLLSIIIPTKNRQYTTLYAIESALAVHKDNIEVIVQDCSDTNILQQQVEEKFGTDTRIKYHYTDTKPSMTDNWNAAFDRAQGEYLCAIGDDDAVLPQVYDAAVWAKTNNILAVAQKEFIVYFWPDYRPQPLNGTLNYINDFSDDFTVLNDLPRRLEKYSSLLQPMDYMYFPQSYHCVFSRTLIAQLKKDTGVFLDSTSLDVYTAVAFVRYLREYAVAQHPFTIRGACGKSNTQRLGKRKAIEHFKEFTNIDFPAILPPVYDFYTTVTESFIKACNNTKQQKLISNIKLPELYANIASANRNSYIVCKKWLLKNVDNAAERKRFSLIYRKNKINPMKIFITSSVKKLFPFVLSFYRKLRPIQMQRTIVQSSTIIEAIEIIEKNRVIK